MAAQVGSSRHHLPTTPWPRGFQSVVQISAAASGNLVGMHILRSPPTQDLLNRKPWGFIPEAPEGEKEEPEGPLREQDLKEAYIELIRGVQEWQDGCVYRGEFGLDVKLGCGEFSWPTGEGEYIQLCSQGNPCSNVAMSHRSLRP
ncbi:ankyrin repeat and MYND domain-containing protein 1 isoform X4 [Eschrichtius robustus]|uniref:ankyrin repeat and MYND domain-containing protein 1 isoform X4 n=1 Tax=Eschrichtius robustus TaxID=9764 RepID=UPI0035C1DA86